MRAFAVMLALAGCKDTEPTPGKTKAPPQPAPSREALDRKARSMAKLDHDGVHVMAGLPVIRTVAESRPRDRDAVGDRSIALMLVSLRSEGLQGKELADLRDKFGAAAFSSPHEAAYLANPSPTKADTAAFNWRYECLGVTLWALNLEASLPPPDQMVDAGRVVKRILEPGPAAFRARARLRESGEILDADDLYYRYDWACTDARVTHKAPPAGVNCEVVQERHYALNWLIGYEDQAWDDVSTDT